MRTRLLLPPSGPTRALSAGGLLIGLLAGLAPRHASAGDDPFGPMRRPQAPADPRGGPATGRPETPTGPVDIAAMKPWLAEESWLCRAFAARELAHRSDDGTIALLTPALEREDDPRVLAFLLSALSGRPRDDLLAEGGVALADRLVALLGHAHPGVAGRALRALTPMAPVRLGTEPAPYLQWWAKGRDGLALEATLAREHVLAARAAAAARATKGTALAPGETKTVGPASLDRFRDLERIHRDGLEIVVCLDSTGSMGDVIAAAKAHVVDLVKRLRSLAPRVRVGLVTYDDGAEVRIALTSDELAVERELKKVFAEGGGDEEEGVDKAVLLALRGDRVAWSQKALRVILVVGDAPPHEDDVPGFLRALAQRRDDPLFEAPVRVDTVSTAEGNDTDAAGLVPHFREIATAGHGTAVRLASTRDLLMELLLACFGPAWREPLRELLRDIDALESEARPAVRRAR